MRLRQDGLVLCPLWFIRIRRLLLLHTRPPLPPLHPVLRRYQVQERYEATRPCHLSKREKASHLRLAVPEA